MAKPYYKVKDYRSQRSIGYLLRRSSKLITGRIEQLCAKENISFVQWVILMHLRDGLLTTAAELGQHLCHDSGAMTRVLDQMEERGLISRERSQEDRRRVELKLAPEGLKIIDTFLPRIIHFYNDDILDDFTAEETDLLISLLTRLITKLSVEKGD